jgi:amino acid adenylation domain-containing protein/non-ribosomal peptide synthase protein (TIGR01720 family)
MLVLQNQDLDTLQLPGLTATLPPLEFPFAKFDLTLSLLEDDTHLVGVFEYSTDLFAAATIERMADHFAVLLEAIVAQPAQPVLSLPLLTDAEYHQIVHDWNDTAVDYGAPQTIQTLFEQQVARTPDAVALIFKAQQLTYAELNARANQLAHYLVAQGVQPDTLVALLLARSVEMVVGVLGVLKAGGAYVPIDPTYPEERIRYLLADSAAAWVLTQSDADVTVPPEQAIVLDQSDGILSAQSTQNPLTGVSPEHLAYVIYTSGSTGQPKGVMIEHQAVCNLVSDNIHRFAMSPASTVLHAPTFGFDVEVGDLFMTLCSGATLYLPAPEKLIGQFLSEQLTRSAATHVSLTPVALSTLPVETYAGLQTVIVAGEALPDALTQRWLPLAAIWNAYGPTENTIYTTATLCQVGTRVHIGKPLANVHSLILDQAGKVVPIGVAGELYLGGRQLARGYLNQPELTAERFIQHPVFGRLYQTGDLCRWLPDGNIDYLGRTDFQVKIRGFRIELGEIEQALLAQSEVREAVVLAREDQPGDKRLVAYLVGDVADTDDLRQQLAQRLPDYMIPAAFVVLDALPLTPNGKLDRRVLPAPDYHDEQATFVAPRNTTEAALSQIFADVLRLDQVGIHDHFFRLGGDSILSIQLVSRAAQQGLFLSVKQVFQSPTIAQLASIAGNAQAITAAQTLQTGAVPLLPIQHWFLAADQPDWHHFNQSFVFTVKKTIDQTKLTAALQTLLQHHDALRLQYQPDGDGWQQTYLAEPPATPLEIVDLRQLTASERAVTIEQQGAHYQTNLNPGTGDVARFVYFQCDEAGADRLLVVIHHLAVDGVSWRILLEDLHTLLTGGSLPAKTHSYRDWGEALQVAARAGQFDREIPYWLEQVAPLPQTLLAEQPEALNTVGNSHHLRLTLSVEQTTHLLRTLPEQHQMTVDAVLLTALTETLLGDTEQTGLCVRFESHGRQELFDTINLNRTIGWFTSAYPLRIPRVTGGAVKRIRYTMNSLRQVTDGGLSYGALRYFHPDEAIRAQFAALPVASVVYNYLGQLGSLENAYFGPAPESAGASVAPTFRRDAVLESNAWVIADQLQIDWTVTPQLTLATAQALQETFRHTLDDLIMEALQDTQAVAIPADFADATLTCAQLEALLATQTPPETLYQVSPLQAGMLFHSELAPDSGGLYSTQFIPSGRSGV